MKDVVLEIIRSGQYNLRELLERIDVLWLHSRLTDDERTELMQAAQENANPEYGYADFQTQLNTVMDMVISLGKDVAALKISIEALGGTVEEPD